MKEQQVQDSMYSGTRSDFGQTKLVREQFLFESNFVQNPNNFFLVIRQKFMSEIQTKLLRFQLGQKLNIREQNYFGFRHSTVCILIQT